ncbi:hypothetical protein ACA910_000279 [Epithemia clementina (nom. ined.)]
MEMEGDDFIQTDGGYDGDEEARNDHDDDESSSSDNVNRDSGGSPRIGDSNGMILLRKSGGGSRGGVFGEQPSLVHFSPHRHATTGGGGSGTTSIDDMTTMEEKETVVDSTHLPNTMPANGVQDHCVLHIAIGLNHDVKEEGTVEGNLGLEREVSNTDASVVWSLSSSSPSSAHSENTKANHLLTTYHGSSRGLEPFSKLAHGLNALDMTLPASSRFGMERFSSTSTGGDDESGTEEVDTPVMMDNQTLATAVNHSLNDDVAFLLEQVKSWKEEMFLARKEQQQEATLLKAEIARLQAYNEVLQSMLAVAFQPQSHVIDDSTQEEEEDEEEEFQVVNALD